MITATNSALATNTATDFAFTPPSSTASTNSFAQQLTSALEAFLGQTANNSSLEIDITPQHSQNSGTSQFVVTVHSLGSATPSSPSTGSDPASSSTSATSSTPAANAPAAATVNATSGATTADVSSAGNSVSEASGLGSMAGMVAPAGSIAASAALHGVDLSTLAIPTPAPPPLETATDAYWAMQPPAVQALRNMPLADRSAAGMALAQQGYTIDVPIMVWGWDPLMTMQLRQSDGYTWVPSALQANIQEIPGDYVPGLVPYDATNPPPGSITVSTAFAKGTSGDWLVDWMNQTAAQNPVTS
jgi:hypothetical protein